MHCQSVAPASRTLSGVAEIAEKGSRLRLQVHTKYCGTSAGASSRVRIGDQDGPARLHGNLAWIPAPWPLIVAEIDNPRAVAGQRIHGEKRAASIEVDGRPAYRARQGVGYQNRIVRQHGRAIWGIAQR